MTTLNFANIFSLQPQHGLAKAEWLSTKKFLKLYLQQFSTRGQHFHEVLDDKKMVKDIQNFVTKTKGKYKHIVVLGIGGSALGTICIEHSLSHLFKSKKKNTPTLHVLDNVDPMLIQEIQDVIEIPKTLFIVISKSGETPETLSQYLYFSHLVKQKKLPLKDHFVFITGPQKNWLRQTGQPENIVIFDHPDVGGRFSVLTSVALLPSALIGINIEELLRGGRDMRDNFLSLSFTKNLPFQLAAMQYLLFKKGKNIQVLMPYAQKLSRLADWYRQLLAESIGKEVNRQGKIIHAGITPVSALGATDQHSQSQLYNEGPNDKLIGFIEVKNLGQRLPIPNSPPKDLPYLHNTSFQQLLAAEQLGTAQALTERQRPNFTITIEAIDEYHLGQLFFLFQGATAFLGEFFGVNAFDQPGVELAKQLTREILLKNYRR